MTFTNKAKQLFMKTNTESQNKNNNPYPESETENINLLETKSREDESFNKNQELERDVQDLKEALKKNIQELNALKSFQSETVVKNTYQQKQRSLFNKIGEFEKAFGQEYPDYQLAINYIKDRRDQDLALWGCLAKDKRLNIIHTEIIAFAQMAMENAINPAEAAYKMALNWGYRPNNTQKPDTLSKMVDNDNISVVKNDMNNRAVGIKNNINSDTTPISYDTEKSTQHPRSLSHISGQSPLQPTLESLANMNDQDFQKYWQQLISSS